jgi:two-component system, NarL family, response regulator NreC
MKRKAVKVLIADDHAILRAGLRLLIDSQPDMAVAAEAADGAEALAAARRDRPDIMVFDLSMPRTDAAATIRQLTRLGIRTVVLTMHDDRAYVDAALAAGAQGYVVKKAADVELLAAIRAVSRGARFLDAGTERSRRRKPAGASLVPPLSGREQLVVRYLGLGFTNREIAAKLGLSVKTVETFRARACAKLGLRSRADLVRYAMGMGLVAAAGSPEGELRPGPARPPHR